MDIFKLCDELLNYSKVPYILSIVDHFSKYIWAYCLGNKTAEEVLKDFNLALSPPLSVCKIWRRFDKVEFCNTELNVSCIRYNIQYITSSP
ncbi:unnamed protein product [Blepharisma stoltei]|uniref:Integrase catalytic domain-containing protein n=1 Tax=Blepharisma stoltei TaxID=1481888 RepID=A0AAU9IGN9_9CILI|nr:unnamed protein product [Blepharisma stoltei]